jgi:hypothetical protein
MAMLGADMPSDHWLGLNSRNTEIAVRRDSISPAEDCGAPRS